MKPTYLADSYDHVKRVLIEASSSPHWLAAMLLTVPMSKAQIDGYKTFLRVDAPRQFLSSPLPLERDHFFQALRELADNAKANILLDPCTGLKMNNRFRPKMREYLSLSEFVSLSVSSDRLLLCFDQSLSRGLEGADRAAKLAALKSKGVSGFYFKSHVSFLCASCSVENVKNWANSLFSIGIPNTRLQSNFNLGLRKSV